MVFYLVACSCGMAFILKKSVFIYVYISCMWVFSEARGEGEAGVAGDCESLDTGAEN